MARLWISLKRSFQCKSVISDVDDTGARSNRRNPRRKKSSTRSVSSRRDGRHSNYRHRERQPSRSPISLWSSDLPNVMAHEVNPSNSSSKQKSIGCCGNICGDSGSTIVSTVSPRTPVFGGDGLVSSDCRASPNFPDRRGDSPSSRRGDTRMSSELRSFPELDSCSPTTLICRICGESFSQTAPAEAHHLSEHAVSELGEGDSSRRIVEIICRTALQQSENNHIRMGTILKICNMQRRIALFEDYRDIVKIKARQLRTKHTRCRADGNELLRFYGTTIVCSLGANGSSAVCEIEQCGVCQILRHGFSENEFNGGIGIFTTSTAARALDLIELEGDENNENRRKAVVVCRAIAGMVHKPLETFEESLRGFQSLAGKVGENAIIEDLYLLNPNALLPCFVVISA